MLLAELGGLHFVCLVLCGRRAILSHAQPPCAPSSFSKQAAVMAERFKDAERRRIELDEVHRCISKPTTPHSWHGFISPHRVCSRPRSGLRRRFRSEAFIKTRNWTASRLLLMRCATHSSNIMKGHSSLTPCHASAAAAYLQKDAVLQQQMELAVSLQNEIESRDVWCMNGVTSDPRCPL